MAEALIAGAGQGAPVFWTADRIDINALPVPSLRSIPGFRDHPGKDVGPLVVAAVETGHPTAIALALQHERMKDSLRQLAVAGWRDILGGTIEEISDELSLGAGAFDYAPRSVNRTVAVGRKKWARLGAWPWWCFGPTGRPPHPRDWITSPAAAQAFEKWHALERIR